MYISVTALSATVITHVGEQKKKKRNTHTHTEIKLCTCLFLFSIVFTQNLYALCVAVAGLEKLVFFRNSGARPSSLKSERE